MTSLTRVLPLLQCPACRQSLRRDNDALACPTCGMDVPTTGGIPRFVIAPVDETSRKTQLSFGYEWSHFPQWELSGATNFQEYFAGLDLSTLASSRVLDAGCGMGRHARQLAPHARHVVAVDFSQAIDQAARNCDAAGNVDCVQADIMALPFDDGTFDYAYSMGVLHHLTDTEAALSSVVRCVKPGGRVRVYLYWKHHGWRGAVLRLVDAARHLTTRMPFWLLRASCFLLSVALWLGVVLPYRALLAAGLKSVHRLPLAVYTKYPFTILFNDQFDRFSAPLEKRYDQEEVVALMKKAGLDSVSVRPAYGWLAEGTRPLSPAASVGRP